MRATILDDEGAYQLFAGPRQRPQVAVRHRHFAHHQNAIVAGEAPQRQPLEHGETFELLDLRLTAQVRHRRMAVEPDVLELVLRHAVHSG
jgi:hypothetical protein